MELGLDMPRCDYGPFMWVFRSGGWGFEVGFRHSFSLLIAVSVVTQTSLLALPNYFLILTRVNNTWVHIYNLAT